MVTGLYAGILGLVYITLSFMVIRQRLGNNVGLSDGNNDTITRAVRVHANFAEYVPIALALMLIVELNTVSPFEGAPIYLHVFGVILVLSRIGHAYGLTKSAGRTAGRFAGTIGTFFVIFSLSLIAVTQYAIT